MKTTRSFSLHSAKLSDVEWIARQEAQVYSADDAIPTTRLREWFAIAPRAFNIIADSRGTRVGHLNILPIKPDAFQGLLHGTVRERDIVARNIYTSDERDLVSSLWLESIAIDVSGPYLRARALLSVLEQIADAIQRVANLKPSMLLYALSATRAGDKLVHRFGFELVSLRTERRDGHDLHRTSFEAADTRRKRLLSADQVNRPVEELRPSSG